MPPTGSVRSMLPFASRSFAAGIVRLSALVMGYVHRPYTAHSTALGLQVCR